ncbi:hypothetical protein IFM89_002376 [Coptis chinensis]|uniref:Uncharacterized protein n=1 Tax=Coptis chinensis TaxID=261450 RepID=A0A835IJ23_9MAGN|nr:hypothetical protein IFM89_002376 [Coptis chinensis]
MVLVSALFVTATKLAGKLVTVTVAANAFSFAGYRNKNLKPFRSPIDETSDTLADFFNENLNPSNEEENGEESQFFFGLTTAPAHVEDKFNDAWLQFAEEQPSDVLKSFLMMLGFSLLCFGFFLVKAAAEEEHEEEEEWSIFGIE